MENQNIFCPIWGTPVEQIIRYPEGDIASVVLGSPRTDGNYEIATQTIDYVGTLDLSQKTRLTTMIIEERRKTGRTPVVTPQLIKDAKRATPHPPHMRAERLLRFLVNTPHAVGEQFENQRVIEAPQSSAWSESKSPTEVQFLVNYLENKGWLKKVRNGYEFIITVNGYERVAEQATKRDLSQCFVAMWFDDSMKQAYEEGIKKAVEACGYTSMKIDEKQHLNKIDDEIIAEIRRSRFVVADFTHDAEKGVRGSVYYEAGFAYGLGLPVIYSCHKDLEKELHFDTRQYPHILWEKPEDLYTRLTERIGAVIGDYKAELNAGISE